MKFVTIGIAIFLSTHTINAQEVSRRINSEELFDRTSELFGKQVEIVASCSEQFNGPLVCTSGNGGKLVGFTAINIEPPDWRRWLNGKCDQHKSQHCRVVARVTITRSSTDTSGAKIIALQNDRIELLPISFARLHSAFVDLSDLRAAPKDHQKKNIVTLGFLRSFGGSAYVATNDRDTNPIRVNFEKLPTAQKKFILDNCAHGCDASIAGRLVAEFGMPTLNAENMEFWRR